VFIFIYIISTINFKQAQWQNSNTENCLVLCRHSLWSSLGLTDKNISQWYRHVKMLTMYNNKKCFMSWFLPFLHLIYLHIMNVISYQHYINNKAMSLQFYLSILPYFNLSGNTCSLLPVVQSKILNCTTVQSSPVYSNSHFHVKYKCNVFIHPYTVIIFGSSHFCTIRFPEDEQMTDTCRELCCT